MGCRCKERGQALGRAASALAKGQVGRAAGEVRFVARSGVEDAAALARKSAQSLARLRLTSGRR